MTMRNLGKLGRGLLTGAFALSLSLSLVACGSSSGSGTGGTGGGTPATSAGGTIGSGGTNGAGGGSMGGMMTAQDGGMDAPATDSGPSEDAGSNAQQHAVHLSIINGTPGSPGITVTRPAPSISYDMCKI